MAHFAKLNDENIVEQVIVVSNEVLLDDNGIESEQKGVDFCVAHYGGRWVQTSYNDSFRGFYAGIGNLYNELTNEFEQIITETPNDINEL